MLSWLSLYSLVRVNSYKKKSIMLITVQTCLCILKKISYKSLGYMLGNRKVGVLVFFFFFFFFFLYLRKYSMKQVECTLSIKLTRDKGTKPVIAMMWLEYRILVIITFA